MATKDPKTKSTNSTRAMTTKSRKRSERPSKPLLRAWAWIVAAVSFFTPAAGFAVKTAAAPVSAGADQQPDVIVRRVIRRIVIETPTQGVAPRVVYVNSPTSAASSVTAPVATTAGS